MKKPTVYIETSIISFLTSRPSSALPISWFQQMTHAWWDTCRENYHLFVSDAVRREISSGDAYASRLRIDATEGIDILISIPEVKSLAQELMESHTLPPQSRYGCLAYCLGCVLRHRLFIDVELQTHCQPQL